MSVLRISLDDGPPARLDKRLSAHLPEEAGLSRSRLTALIKAGALRNDAGQVLSDPSAKISGPQELELTLPAPEPDHVEPEAIPLEIHFEDDALLIVNKPAGMVVHPAPGAMRGTLVAALLHHCGTSLSGIGGVMRPGIVHRIDKDTSGLLVVAKTDRAHQGLATQFAEHSAERLYDAVVWGVPDPAEPRIAGLEGVDWEGDRLRVARPIGRHNSDRKKMAVTPGGRHAVSRFHVETRYGTRAAHMTCQLETGRTHQIRVHATHIGHPLIGDPVYGRARSLPDRTDTEAIRTFSRQALHARRLGIRHPLTDAWIAAEAPLPDDIVTLIHAIACLDP